MHVWEIVHHAQTKIDHHWKANNHLSLVKQTPLESTGVKRRLFAPRSYGSCSLKKLLRS